MVTLGKMMVSVVVLVTAVPEATDHAMVSAQYCLLVSHLFSTTYELSDPHKGRCRCVRRHGQGQRASRDRLAPKGEHPDLQLGTRGVVVEHRRVKRPRGSERGP